MKREQMTIRLPADLKKEIQQRADKNGISFNAMIVWAIQKGLEKV